MTTNILWQRLRNTPATQRDLSRLHPLILHRDRVASSNEMPNTASPPISTEPNRRTSPIKHRGVKLLNIQAQVRQLLGTAMGRSSDISRFSRSQRDSDGPEIPMLKLNLDTSQLKGSPWNKGAWTVFASYLDTSGRLLLPKKESEKQAYRIPLTSGSTPSRGKLLIRGREPFVTGDPKLQKLLPILESLTLDCISEDEAEHAHGNPRYIIYEPAWRSSEFGMLMRTLDSLHLAGRFNKTVQQLEEIFCMPGFAELDVQWRVFLRTACRAALRPWMASES
ncbi:hypothetical protein B0H14DRAFT_2617463 [Mycena olivaceomarginata]|nr:hypothetical protein B0H14DRAFT_2617463 [Mycena olivaceomarginata]